MYEVSSVSRLTPMMFTGPQPTAVQGSLLEGSLFCVEPRNPQEGQTANVEVHSLAAFAMEAGLWDHALLCSWLARWTKRPLPG